MEEVSCRCCEDTTHVLLSIDVIPIFCYFNSGTRSGTSRPEVLNKLLTTTERVVQEIGKLNNIGINYLIHYCVVLTIMHEFISQTLLNMD